MDQNGRVRSLLELKPETDKILAAIVMKCLEPDPEKRYQRAEELYADLNKLTEDNTGPKKNAYDSRNYSRLLSYGYSGSSGRISSDR